MKIAQLPLISTFLQWRSNRSDLREINASIAAFKKFLQKSDLTTPCSLPERTLERIERSKNNQALGKEVAQLERTYFTFLREIGRPVPVRYAARENCNLLEKFTKMGISSEFLRFNPEFLNIARTHFWAQYLHFVKLPIWMAGHELYFPFEVRENSRHFAWKSWSEIKKLNLEDYRITYQGFAIGHSDRSKHLVPLKTVEAQGKYAIQFVTSCPVGRGLPSTIDLKASGHSFIQLINPLRNSNVAEVFSWGFYPRKLADFGLQLFKTIPGIIRNHDSNVSRIEARQVFPIVKQYLFQDDAPNNPCLLAILQNMGTVCNALRAKGYRFSPLSIEHVDRAMIERNEPELDRILIELTKIRELIVEGKIQVPLIPMGREQKALTMIRRAEESQGKHSYHMLGANCTAASYREESFVVAFLDAVLDKDKPVRVYDTQIDMRDHRFGIFDRICNVIERVCVHFFAALPLTGPLLGTGFTHPEAIRATAHRAVPSVFAETAFATHQMLIAPFTPRPLFPAGEILAQDAPVIQPPGIIARIKYLLRRNSLLNHN